MTHGEVTQLRGREPERPPPSAPEPEEQSRDRRAPKEATCLECGVTFPSRNALFRHINETGHVQHTGAAGRTFHVPPLARVDRALAPLQTPAAVLTDIGVRERDERAAMNESLSIQPSRTP